jgi:hypothetical protein
LGSALDAVGGDSQIEPLPCPDQSLDDDGGLKVMGHRGDEAAIDLDTVELQPVEVLQIGIAGAEIVGDDGPALLVCRGLGRLHRSPDRDGEARTWFSEGGENTQSDGGIAEK